MKALTQSAFTAAIFVGFLVLSIVSITKADTPSTIVSAFESTTVKITAKPDALKVPVEWKYTNHTDLPLYIEKIDESCGCLSTLTQVDKIAPVEPEKSGTITAYFTAGGHRGVLRKSIHVRFVGYDKPVELILEATVPSSVEVSQKELTWSDETISKTQTIDVTTGTGIQFAITSLDGIAESQYKITSETIREGGHYRVHITPHLGVLREPQVLILKTNSPDARDQALAVFLTVKKSLETSNVGEFQSRKAQVATP